MYCIASIYNCSTYDISNALNGFSSYFLHAQPAGTTYMYAQFVLDQPYDDVAGVLLFAGGAYLAGTQNLTIWVSQSAEFLNGTKCWEGLGPTALWDASAGFVSLARCGGGAMPSAQYVTVQFFKPGASVALGEIQVLRDRECGR